MVKHKGACGFLLGMCALLWLMPVAGHGRDKQDNLDRVLASAEGFFESLKTKSYSQAWSFLSHRSKEVISNDIYQGSIGGSGTGYTKEQIKSDLQAGGMIASSYWQGVFQSFDPATVLEESKWEMGFVRSDAAELFITHKKSNRPARLKLFNEAGVWKVGLVESFWTRR
ncbi:MAG: hypothetical protein KA801_18155 [Syntrophorhabdaceae bacterium]|nr:hypothetical protein [Syntrophorhabdaceae bacterium]